MTFIVVMSRASMGPRNSAAHPRAMCPMLAVTVTPQPLPPVVTPTMVFMAMTATSSMARVTKLLVAASKVALQETCAMAMVRGLVHTAPHSPITQAASVGATRETPRLLRLPNSRLHSLALAWVLEDLTLGWVLRHSRECKMGLAWRSL